MTRSYKLVKHRNLLFRLMLLIIISLPLFFAAIFYEHFHAYLTGNVINRIIQNEWEIVLMSIVLFLAFLIPLSYRRKVKWTEYGLVTAFFISLFVEMYGIPFTILFAQHWFYYPSITHPPNVLDFYFFGVHLGMDLPMAYAAGLMTIGTLLVVTGWITLYFGIKKEKLVIHGIYAFSRHPQYFGFIIIIVGWLIGWPTLLTTVLAPILIFKYVRVAQQEEEEVTNSGAYHIYQSRVPFFI